LPTGMFAFPSRALLLQRVQPSLNSNRQIRDLE
jgi:hypothetical protein